MTRNPACAICGRDDREIHLTEWDNRRTVYACNRCDPEAEIPEPHQPLTFAERVYNWIRRNPDCTFQDICDGFEISDEGEEGARQRDVVSQRIAYMVRQKAVEQSKGRPRTYRVPGEEKTPSKVLAEVKAPTSRQVRWYRRSTKEGRCPRCNQVTPEGWDKTYCEPCMEKRKRPVAEIPDGHCHCCRCLMLEEWKQFKSCPECRERKNRTERARRKVLSPEQRERIRVKSQVKRDKLRAEGKCYWCREPATASYCESCAKIHRERLRQRRMSKIVTERPRDYVCGLCKEVGHNARTCRARARAEAFKEAA